MVCLSSMESAEAAVAESGLEILGRSVTIEIAQQQQRMGGGRGGGDRPRGGGDRPRGGGGGFRGGRGK